MTEPATTTLSVRGEARREVDPDSARFDTRVRTIAPTKADAIRIVSEESRQVLAGLAQLGGAVLTAADERRDLGWLAHGAVTWEEFDWHDEQRRPTGRINAAIAAYISVRDFALIDDIAAVLDDHDLVHLNGVEWAVDHDNPAWAEVRASAIAAALAKGRDYAAALGGTLTRVEHIADAGLLGGRAETFNERVGVQAASFKAVGDETDSPPLDPAPQTLRAVIEARFTATVAPLTSQA